MDAVTVQALANAMMSIFYALSLFLQQALSTTLGLNLPITVVLLILLVIVIYALSRSSVFSLVAAGFLFILLVV